MRPIDDSWVIDEDPAFEAIPDFLELSEVRQHARHTSDEVDELGLRQLLERPEALSRSWWRTEQRRAAA